MNTNFLLRKPCSNKTLGIEIEGVLPEYPRINSEVYDSFFYVTTDGSINAWPAQGREFVSQPMTADFLKRAIRKLYSKYMIDHNASCGIHIHASRKWLSLEKAKVIHEFLNTLDKSEVREVFGRISDYANFWCSFGATRYNAINNENKDTVEFRMFRSGSCSWAQYCVDTVVYLIENAYHLNKDALFAFRDISFKKYNL